MEDELDAIARTEIQERWDVFDADGERVGEVSEVHDTAFTLETTVGGSVEVDFTDVESADDGCHGLERPRSRHDPVVPGDARGELVRDQWLADQGEQKALSHPRGNGQPCNAADRLRPEPGPCQRVRQCADERELDPVDLEPSWIDQR